MSKHREYAWLDVIIIRETLERKVRFTSYMVEDET